MFLSSHRLSFLESESTFWSESFWSTPQLGIALAGLCLCLRWLADNSLSSSIAAALSFAFVGWLDPRSRSASRGRCSALDGRGEKVAPDSRFGVRPRPIPSFSRRASSRRFASRLWWLVRRGEPHPIRHCGSRARFCACRRGHLATVALRPASRNSSRNMHSRRSRAMDPRILCSRDGADARSPHAQRVGAYAALGGSSLWTLSRGWRTWDRFTRSFQKSGASCLEACAGAQRHRSCCRPSFFFPFLGVFPIGGCPFAMDRIWVASVAPISGNLLAMSAAIRETTEPDAVFVAGESYAPWIPALSGRRVLLAGGEPPDRLAREASERAFAFSKDADAIASAAAAWGLTHLAWGRLDQPSSDENGPLVSTLRSSRRAATSNSSSVFAAGCVSLVMPRLHPDRPGVRGRLSRPLSTFSAGTHARQALSRDSRRTAAPDP